MRKDQEPISQDYKSPFITMDETLKGIEIEKRRRDQKKQQRYRAYVWGTIVATIGISTIIFLAGEEVGHQNAQQEAVRLLAEDEFSVKSAERIKIVKPVEQGNLIDWQATKTAYEKTFQEAINFNNAREIIKPLRQIAINHTLYGAQLINKTRIFPQIETEYELNRLTIEGGIVFNLNEPRDFYLASAIIDSRISFIFWSREVLSDDPKRAEKAKKALDETKIDLFNLYYLRDKIDNLYFTNDSFLYFPKELFVSIAKITQSFERHGYPIPKTILVAGAGEDQGGFYVTHNQPNSPFTVVIRSNIWDGGIVHEYAHFLHDARHFDSQNKEKTTKVSLENYQQVMEAAKLLHQNQSTDLKNQYVSEYAMDGVDEDYAETFMWYFWYGDDFRTKLEELQFKDSAAYAILKTKYDFFKNVDFEDEEFHNKGISLNGETGLEVDSKIRDQIQTDYQIGDVVTIVDEDEENPGILLRPQPVASIDYKDQSWPAVFDGDEVEIIGGPEEFVRFITNNETGETTPIEENLWRVRISWQGAQSYRLLGWINGEGWISEIWFGEKVEKGQ